MIKLFTLSLITISLALFSTPEEEVKATVESTLEHISGPSGGDYQWDEFRALFTEKATVVGFAYPSEMPEPQIHQYTIEAFIERFGPIYEKYEFYENSTSTEINISGNIAHVWQHYETFGTDREPMETGVNAYTLIKVKGEWKISHLCWDSDHQ